jgi:predicted protein tyrosine phosphatase
LSNLLFICSKNQWRSPTAELLFKNNPLHEAKSAGTSEKARIKINHKLIEWATVVFVMERKHKEIIKQNFQAAIKDKQIVVLNIADDYSFGDEELVNILKTALAEYL